MIGLSPVSIDNEVLRESVERRLCELGHLEPKQFPMTQREVVRNGKTCGLYFCVHGPRSVKITAIADFKARTLILYGSDGIRRESIPLPCRRSA